MVVSRARKPKQQQSTHLGLKIALRAAVRAQVGAPFLLECYGGSGAMYRACWRACPGVVLEKDPAYVGTLARERPTWKVYEGDTVAMLHAGLVAYLPITLVDCDPYGQPWPALEAFLMAQRVWQESWGLVVTDGGIQKIQLSGGWDMPGWEPYIQRYGNGLMAHYLAVCRERLQDLVTSYGYDIAWWHGQYGVGRHIAYYGAVLRRRYRDAGSPVVEV